jgi:hypothetical protein
MTAGPTTQSVKSSGAHRAPLQAGVSPASIKTCSRHGRLYRMEYLGLGSVAEIHYDFSGVAGLGEFDCFFELLKWEAMGDDR